MHGVAALKGHPAAPGDLIGCLLLRCSAGCYEMWAGMLTGFSAVACGNCADLHTSKCSDIHCWCQVHLSEHWSRLISS